MFATCSDTFSSTMASAPSAPSGVSSKITVLSLTIPLHGFILAFLFFDRFQRYSTIMANSSSEIMVSLLPPFSQPARFSRSQLCKQTAPFSLEILFTCLRMSVIDGLPKPPKSRRG
jgi:hypothetical protein